MEDWDLQAVVRGCNYTNEAFTNIMINDNYNSPSPYLFSPLSSSVLDQDDDLLMTFPEFFEPTTTVRDFDHLLHHQGHKEINYKPCYPLLHQQKQQPLSPQSILSPTSSISMPSSCEVKEPENLQKKHPLSESDHHAPAVRSSDDAAVKEAKPKRSRKNQQKRVVKHVKADGLSSDMWAWRKYGQKPIKGSPHPRSYYRCSSLKGCLARKQVERSNSDPSIFIVTYTAEHSHAYPTRRNSLAGSTRIKSSVVKQPNSAEPTMLTIKQECLSDPVAPSLSMASINEDDQVVQHVRIKNEDEEEEEEDRIISNEDIVMPDIIFSDELFPSLEDFEGPFLDQFSAKVA